MTILNKRKDKISKSAVYVGRGSKWGNPFPINKNQDRDRVCELYEEWLEEEIEQGNITEKEIVESLLDKDLVCYCSPLKCHAETLQRKAESLRHKFSVFRVIIAGGRDYKITADTIKKVDFLLSNKKDFAGTCLFELVTGCASGADQIPYEYKRKIRGARGVRIEEFHADWNNLEAKGAVIKKRADGTKYNARAGNDRNIQMGEYGNALIAFWDGKSTGTKDMINIAKALRLKVKVIRY
jgi:hypothetical protein